MRWHMETIGSVVGPFPGMVLGLGLATVSVSNRPPQALYGMKMYIRWWDLSPGPLRNPQS